MFSTVRGIKQYPNLGEINRLCVYLYYHSKSTYSVNWTSLIKQWTQLDSHKTMPIHRCDGTVTTKRGRGDLYNNRPASQSTGAKWLQITSVIISTNIQQDGNIIYCKMHQHISHWHISHSNNLKYWRAFWMLWICTSILQSCVESQDENSTLIFFYQHREYELLYSWSRTKGEDLLLLTGVTLRQSKMTQQMSINYHTIRFHFHKVSIYFFSSLTAIHLSLIENVHSRNEAQQS